MNYLTVRRPGNGTSVISDFDRLFDSVFGAMPSWNDATPAVDIRNEESMYVIDADLPGMSDDQIDVRVENDLLVISATAEENRTEGKKEQAEGRGRLHPSGAEDAILLPQLRDAQGCRSRQDRRGLPEWGVDRRASQEARIEAAADPDQTRIRHKEGETPSQGTAGGRVCHRPFFCKEVNDSLH
jgi:hypothetical protein